MNCVNCGKSDLTVIGTYKRVWYLCHDCGEARPVQKDSYRLTFLKDPLMKKIATSEDAVYDYFVQQGHIDYSIGTAHDFMRDHVDRSGIDFSGKSLLDISGGNGHFLAELQKLTGAGDMAITEINKPTLDYIEQAHPFRGYLFNFNSHRLSKVVDRKFDAILARAAIMFCNDLKAFVEDSRNVINDGGLLVINHSVIPTLGVMLRVQLDEFSYFALRQPDEVVRTAHAAGFELLYRADETDPSMYVYDHDMVRDWWLAKLLYEQRGANKLMAAERKAKNGFTFRARDRRRSTMIFRKM